MPEESKYRDAYHFISGAFKISIEVGIGLEPEKLKRLMQDLDYYFGVKPMEDDRKIFGIE